MSSPLPTVRTIARALGLSPTTVSDALNGRGRVNPATAALVRSTAKKMGYEHNPLTGAVMSALRRARSVAFRGTLALIDVREPDRDPPGPFHVEIGNGFESRAGELGFRVELFRTGPTRKSLQRLDGILASRGIRGAAVLPSWIPPDLRAIDWTRTAGLYTDYLIRHPALNSVCADHYHLMITALAELAARGYEAPGYLVPRGRDERIEHRQTAAFRAFQATNPRIRVVPLLITEDDPTREDFERWFVEHAPDVVLGHSEQILDWMLAAGVRVPEAHGFVLLNVVERSRPCAALDLQGGIIGQRAAEMLVGQILRNEFGVPASPSRIAVQPRWIEGTTVRPQSAARRKPRPARA
ncbi:hypothetical protein ASA1KI_06820 [Opitutales bacterium ASA1]|uniref:substrate-binding domain-containing protein n=1 Tax=Congregicoccus parvus TaxID=3081749 RepID=UPI002B28EC9B|nr:hypothetical protein ASA1KI_06820 [Opitutales bacterium ASA1]